MSEPRAFATDGKGLRCRGWRQEGLLRLLENVLTVAEDPQRLIVYAALGKAARNRPAYEAIVGALKDLRDDETLIVQSGKPIAVLTTHARAPLVLMANCNIVGRWANEEVFYDLEQRGLICWGGLTAGCWQYIGSQGVLQGTYEILVRAAARLGAADLRGRFFSPRVSAAWAPHNPAPHPCSAPPASSSRSTQSVLPSGCRPGPSTRSPIPSRTRSHKSVGR